MNQLRPCKAITSPILINNLHIIATIDIKREYDESCIENVYNITTIDIKGEFDESCQLVILPSYYTILPASSKKNKGPK